LCRDKEEALFSVKVLVVHALMKVFSNFSGEYRQPSLGLSVSPVSSAVPPWTRQQVGASEMKMFTVAWEVTPCDLVDA
jgi:hypothetical protein